jgi:predicted NBD/HSP70 family sugar kinase
MPAPKIAQQWLREILAVFYQRRTLTRGEVVEATGLNAASVSHALRFLLTSGTVIKTGEIDSGAGRPREVLRVNGEAAYFAAIDLEGTRLRFGLTNLLGDICCRWEHDFRYASRLEMSRLLHGVEMVLGGLDPSLHSRVLAAGISYPGLMEPDGHLTAVNLGWNRFPFRDEVERILPFPVFLQADGHTCVEAESSHGQAQGRENWMFVIVENGVGVGISVDGRPIDACGLKGGELGHCTVDPAAPDICKCGKRGCLEAIASSPNIVRQYFENTGAGAAPPADFPVTEVFERARSGDKTARVVVERAARALGLALSHAVNLFAPELIILGGDAISAQDLILPLLREALDRHALAGLARNVEITVSKLGLDIRLKGAASLAFRRSLADPMLLQKICSPLAVPYRVLEYAQR